MNHNDPLLKKTLKSVSRSFYLSLNVLPAETRSAIGLGYLLCRAADTIADTDLVPAAERLELLNDLSDIMNQFPLRKEALEAFGERLKAAITTTSTSEGRLLSSFKDAATLLLSFSRTDQAQIQWIVRQVIAGMKIDLTVFGSEPVQETVQTVHSFKTRDELETYIGFIGGDPGRFWTKVSLEHDRGFKVKNPPQWEENGFKFGTGLQMVNILRDISEDLKIGRCYIPSVLLQEQGLKPLDLLEKEAHQKFLPLYHRLIDETVDRLAHGIDYLHEIPPSHFRLRAAVWWPLALGLKTLERLRKRYAVLDPAKSRKISKAAVWMILAASPVVLSSNRTLDFVFRRMKEETKPF